MQDGAINQVFFKKTSFREYADADLRLGQKSSLRYITEFEQDHPEIAEKYFDMKWGEMHHDQLL